MRLIADTRVRMYYWHLKQVNENKMRGWLRVCSAFYRFTERVELINTGARFSLSYDPKPIFKSLFDVQRICHIVREIIMLVITERYYGQIFYHSIRLRVRETEKTLKMTSFFRSFFFNISRTNSKTSKVNQQSVYTFKFFIIFLKIWIWQSLLTVSLSKLHRQNFKNILFLQRNKWYLEKIKHSNFFLLSGKLQ